MFNSILVLLFFEDELASSWTMWCHLPSLPIDHLLGVHWCRYWTLIVQPNSWLHSTFISNIGVCLNRFHGMKHFLKVISSSIDNLNLRRMGVLVFFTIRLGFLNSFVGNKDKLCVVEDSTTLCLVEGCLYAARLFLKFYKIVKISLDVMSQSASHTSLQLFAESYKNKYCGWIARTNHIHKDLQSVQ